jgi:hypothetical protein
MDKGLNWEYAEFWRQKEAHDKQPRSEGLGRWWEVGGKSRGYWAEIARNRLDREAEARHSTKYGQYWAGSRHRPNGRAYTLSQSPYDAVNNFEGQRWGSAAHPVRFDIVICQSRRTRVLPALRRWAAEPPGLRPYGLRPYERKWQQAIASRVVTDRLRLSDDPYNYQRLRDLKAHILECRRESGSLFQDTPWDPKSAECARGIRWAELESIELYRRHDQLRWILDAGADDHNLRGTEEGYRESGGIPHGLDSKIAFDNNFSFEEVDNTVARRRERYGKPLRERRKVGRKPIGPVAMTTAERVAKHRRAKQLQALATPESPQTGVRRPSPLGLSAPVTTQGDTMDVFERLSAALAKANAAPPDARVFDVLSPAEWCLIVVAARANGLTI